MDYEKIDRAQDQRDRYWRLYKKANLQAAKWLALSRECGEEIERLMLCQQAAGEATVNRNE